MVLQKQIQDISGLKQHLLLAWVCRLSVWHCFRSWGQVQGLLHVQVSVSRLKECLSGACPFLMVKDRRAGAKLIKQTHVQFLFRFSAHHIPSHSVVQTKSSDWAHQYSEGAYWVGGGDVWTICPFLFLKYLGAFNFSTMQGPAILHFLIPFISTLKVSSSFKCSQ